MRSKLTFVVHPRSEELSPTGRHPLKNHKATKPAFNVQCHHQPASETPLIKWRFAGQTMIPTLSVVHVFGSSTLINLKKNLKMSDLQNFLDPRMKTCIFYVHMYNVYTIIEGLMED